MLTIYEVPETLLKLQEDFFNDDVGFVQYRIIDYTIDSMDNRESMTYFLNRIDGLHDDIFEDLGTMVGIELPNGERVRIDAGGLGDFYSHSFEVTAWED